MNREHKVIKGQTSFPSPRLPVSRRDVCAAPVVSRRHRHWRAAFRAERKGGGPAAKCAISFPLPIRLRDRRRARTASGRTRAYDRDEITQMWASGVWKIPETVAGYSNRYINSPPVEMEKDNKALYPSLCKLRQNFTVFYLIHLRKEDDHLRENNHKASLTWQIEQMMMIVLVQAGCFWLGGKRLHWEARMRLIWSESCSGETARCTVLFCFISFPLISFLSCNLQLSWNCAFSTKGFS